MIIYSLQLKAPLRIPPKYILGILFPAVLPDIPDATHELRGPVANSMCIRSHHVHQFRFNKTLRACPNFFIMLLVEIIVVCLYKTAHLLKDADILHSCECPAVPLCVRDDRDPSFFQISGQAVFCIVHSPSGSTEFRHNIPCVVH